MSGKAPDAVQSESELQHLQQRIRQNGINRIGNPAILGVRGLYELS
ncbi:hypothetical protein VCBJG01_3403 [Vibrio cholerae BJG-01]|nr:hypothetical protein VCBJG01_3403 [Vibrio cholerae BJG-01]